MDPVEYVRDLVHYEVVAGLLPSDVHLDEYQLVRRLSSPRAAVRAALNSLSEAGVLHRARRVGTTAQQPLTHFKSSGTPSFWTGSGPIEMVTFNSERLRPPREIAEDLNVDEGTFVTLLERATVASGAPVIHWRIWTPLDVGGTFPSGIPVTMTWYEALKEMTGESVFHVVRGMSEAIATPRDEKILDVSAGEAITFIHRHTRLANGRPVDVSFSRRIPRSGVVTERLIVSI